MSSDSSFMADSHTPNAALAAASCFLQALKDLLATHTDAFPNHELAARFAIIHQDSCPEPSSPPQQRLTRPSQQAIVDMIAASPAHPSERDVLKPPPSVSPYANSVVNHQYTSIERAFQYVDTLNCLLRRHPDAPLYPESSAARNTKHQNKTACLCTPQTNDPWQDLLSTGEQARPDEWRTLWRMVNLLEAGNFTSAIVADSFNAPTGSLLRSELACLFALVCRQLSRLDASHLDKPDESGGIDVVITTFTPDTVRVLQASLFLASQPPQIHVYKQLDKPMTSVTGPEVSIEWRELVSWMCAAPAGATAPEPFNDSLSILKHREETDTALGGSDSSRSTSASSTLSRDTAA
ncbi:uncharacterized protein LY79DRAFT_568445 [Colletotrichum navitas]|uniref:Uncharacterized protein n=1 Tax=Colletotrichum navitas TaxID=681940 RepID=A0AAD8PPU5_9PEZI|nr:uncharacterized protein LY79DRAFT_568445 [Colletotrichum navitas]KAK1573488.1 hypothetical protein LY79DRAFT_568445 [Colletotrichum navitas]